MRAFSISPSLSSTFSERLPQRLHQLVDGLLARRQIAFRAFLELLQRDVASSMKVWLLLRSASEESALKASASCSCALLRRASFSAAALRSSIDAGVQLGQPRVALGDLVVALGDRALQAGHPRRGRLCGRAALGFVAQLVRQCWRARP